MRAMAEVEVLRPSPWKWLLLVAGSLAFVACGVWMLQGGRSSAVVAWSATIFFGLCGLTGLLVLIPGANYLRLTPEGFTICSLWRKRSYGWSEISEFGVVVFSTGLARQKRVGMNYVPSAGRPLEKLRRMNVSLCGYEGILPDDYGLGYEELARRMKERLAAARQER